MKVKLNKSIILFFSFCLFYFLLPTAVHAQSIQQQTIKTSTPPNSSSSVKTDITTTYTVKSGDSLSSIAASKLGDSSRWSDIYSLNKALISNPDVIYSGEVLVIPSGSSDAPSYSNTIYVSADGKTSTTAPSVNVEVGSGITAKIPDVSESIATAPVPTPTPAPAYNSVPSVKSVTSTVTNSSNYDQMIDAAASQYGVDPNLMKRIIRCESGFNPNAVNKFSGATGIAQFMPSTFYGTWNPYRSEGIYSAHAQIYAMALKISQGGVHAWVCASL